MVKTLFSALLACLAAFNVHAQGATQAVVPFPAGGPLDALARVMTAKLNSPTEPFVVDNRAGANGGIGAKFVAAAPADGRTWLFADGALVSVNPKLYPKDANFDVERDLKAVAGLVVQPAILVVNAASPWKTVQDLVAGAKKRQLNYASGGIGSSGHLTMELFNHAASTDMLHVPYKGAAPAMADLLGGQVDVAFVSVAGAIAHVRSGKLRALAVSGAQRIAALPDVPTAVQAGIADFQVQGAYFLMLSSKTPPALMQAASDKVLKVLADKEVQERLRALGLEPSPMDMTVAGNWLSTDKVRMAKVIAEKNIKAD